MKLLHSADWHLDSPLQGFTPAQQQALRQAQLRLPGQIAALCRKENCQMLLLAGDLFDGAYTKESYQAVYQALEEVGVPVFITPGNHDYVSAQSPWVREQWPENVTVFKEPALVKVDLPQLGCRIYGAGYTAMDAAALMEGFQADAADGYAIGVLHADPTQANSPYCPVTKQQIEDSGLDYLALGHIHKQGALQAGKTLCAWPGCPMGRGYDETGVKGALVVTLEQTVTQQFVPLEAPRFHDLEIQAGEDARLSVGSVLPAVGNEDFYRITLTGSSAPLDMVALAAGFSEFQNLTLRDRTVPQVDPWICVGEDSFEGTYFSLLQKQLETADAQQQRLIELAARISRQVLDGQEVKLP